VSLGCLLGSFWGSWVHESESKATYKLVVVSLEHQVPTWGSEGSYSICMWHVEGMLATLYRNRNPKHKNTHPRRDLCALRVATVSTWASKPCRNEVQNSQILKVLTVMKVCLLHCLKIRIRMKNHKCCKGLGYDEDGNGVDLDTQSAPTCASESADSKSVDLAC
jgi:hypothetical protein